MALDETHQYVTGALPLICQHMCMGMGLPAQRAAICTTPWCGWQRSIRSLYSPLQTPARPAYLCMLMLRLSCCRMAPEVLIGDRSSVASDIFSYGERVLLAPQTLRCCSCLL